MSRALTFVGILTLGTLTTSIAHAAVIIDSFDQTAQSVSSGGVAQTTITTTESLGGYRNLLVVNSTASVSGTSPGTWTNNGARSDVAYGSSLPFLNRTPAPGGAVQLNQDWSAYTGIEIDFNYASGVTLDFEAWGNGTANHMRWQNIAVADSATAFTLAIDFADYTLIDSGPGLAALLADVDGLLFLAAGNSSMNYQISEIRVGSAAAGSSVPVPGTLAVLGLGLVGMRKRNRLRAA